MPSTVVFGTAATGYGAAFPPPKCHQGSQTYWSINVTLMTARSTSHSRGAAFTEVTDGDRQCLSFVYGNRPLRRAESGPYMRAC